MKYTISLALGANTEEKKSRGLEILTRTATDIDSIFPYISVTAVETDSDVQAEDEVFDVDTLFKVVRALRAAGLTDELAEAAIIQLQNAGILFRERA